MAYEPIENFGPVNLVGLSSDTKPTISPVGSTFYETDTGAVYMFAASAWGLDLRDGRDLHVRKTVTFTGAAGLGVSPGTVALFTLTGRVEVRRVSAFCTTLLAVTGTPALTMGTAIDVDAFIALTTATDIDANEWWTAATPATGSKSPLEVFTGGLVTSQASKLLNESIILDLTTATSVDSGVIVFDVWYRPVTDNGRLVAA